MKKQQILFLIILVLSSCSQTELPNQLFTKVLADHSSITFTNEIVETKTLHYYDYLHLFNGAGVGIADFDGDGLMDIIFTANMSGCKVYKNLGNFKFKDFTKKAGLGTINGFITGVSIGDVNADGNPDIYISKSGWDKEPTKRQNILLVNTGDFTFSEEASAYGVADQGHSVNATFFDYDKDGWLDLYVVNTPVDFSLVGKVYDLEDIKSNPYTLQFGSTDHLYRNNGNNTFTDVTIRAGLFNEIGFGLNAQVGDLNNDGWMDLYISNDFISPDFAFLNQQDGTFKESSKQLFGHISYNSMGADIADINNDGLNDLVVVDMSPADYKRSKTTMSMTDSKRFDKMVESNYHRQYMHNMLHLNNGDGTFSEISQLSGVDRTDWSWAPLFADFDNDGFKDLFISNGVLKDVQDRDTDKAVKKIIDQKKSKGKLAREDFLALSQMLPSVPLSNYIFKNNGDLTFSEKMTDWGIEEKSFTNGAAYADLDNDGDLDLILNNINSVASIYRNESQNNNSITISLEGSKGNCFAIGTKVEVWADSLYQVKEVVLSKGYMSTVDPRLHFGLGNHKKIDSLVVSWPNGLVSKRMNLIGEKSINFSQRDAKLRLIKPISIHEDKSTPSTVVYHHKEMPFDDYKKQVLLPHKLSQLGPALAVADVNNDGLQDFFIGGASQFKSALFIQNETNSFVRSIQPTIALDSLCEDISAAFLDVDGDGDVDLVVGAGSYEFEMGAAESKDRLYINDGQGNFSKTTFSLPSYHSVTSVLTPIDFDGDNDLDLFVGNRVMEGEYPKSPASFLFENRGNGYIDVSAVFGSVLSNLGMVTDAKAFDHNKDGQSDLVVVGEWMPITLLINDDGFNEKQELPNSTGWWNTIEVYDFDQDGYVDIAAGNLGLNYKHHASVDHPFHILAGDFDNNGRYDLMLANDIDDELLPVRGRTCSVQQMPAIAEKFATYNAFASASVFDVIGGESKAGQHLKVKEFQSGIFYGSGDGYFGFEAFPIPLQISPINGFALIKNGNETLLYSAGNLYESEVETTRADAGFGQLITIDPERKIRVETNAKTPLGFGGNVKGLAKIALSNNKHAIIVAENNGAVTIKYLWKGEN